MSLSTSQVFVIKEQNVPSRDESILPKENYEQIVVNIILNLVQKLRQQNNTSELRKELTKNIPSRTGH